MGAASSVEQRWSQRRPLTVAVEVCEQSQVLANSMSRNIGLGGVFIESLSQAPLFKDQEVDLFFQIGEDNPTKHRLKAKVVRVDEDGAGFMFRDFDTNAFRALQEIMRQSSASQPA